MIKKKIVLGVLLATTLTPVATPALAATPTKTITIENQKVTIEAKGNVWKNIKGGWYFIKDANLVKDWKYMSTAEGEKTPHWSYFDSKTGRMYTDWHNMGTKEGEKIPH